MLGQFGLVSNPAAVVLSRDLGVVLLAIAAMDWMARDAAAGPALNAILWANLLVQGLETIVDSYHVATSQIAATGVGGIAIHVVLGIAFAMALWKPSPASGQA
jgi:hypothetical protein